MLKRNIEFSSFFFLLIISIASTNLYNRYSKSIDENYKTVINNIYFEKTINHIFDNLTPRYKNINHIIANGETFDKILNSYSITSDEITKIKKELNGNYDLNNLKNNLNIIFTIDETNNKKLLISCFPFQEQKRFN